MRRRVNYPFAAIVGRRAAKHALMLLAVEPQLRGVLIASQGDSYTSSLSRAFAGLAMTDRTDEDSAPINFVELPLNVTEDRLLGGLDLERTLSTGMPQVSRGLLSRADGGALRVDNINLLDPETATQVARALDCRQVSVEREGISAIHSADFVLIGVFDPSEGELHATLRDRVGLIADLHDKWSPQQAAQIIERDFRFERDPAGFAEDFALKTAEIKALLEEARARLPHVRIKKAQLRQLAAAAMSLGVEGNRADIFARRAARANAALAGRDSVTEDDLAIAIQLALVPRATTVPSTAGEPKEREEPRHRDAAEQEEHNENPNRDRIAPATVENLIIRALDARPPEDLLSESPRTKSRGSSKSSKATAFKRGRYARSGPQPTGESRVAIDATLRAAAPFQLRRRLLGSVPATRGNREKALPQIRIVPADLRFKQFKHRAGILFIFAVDASGSMAVNRMAQAKGALTRLLAQAYLHRDKVALISFRGDTAEVLLAPTRSVELAKRLVDALPAGGGTPVSACVAKAIQLARLARLRGMMNAMLVIFTDGRANVRLRHSGATITDELKHLGRLLQQEGVSAAVVDTRSGFALSREGYSLAQMLDARYFYLPRANTTTIYQAIMSGAQGDARHTNG